MLAAVPARADTPVKQFRAFAGNINFTGTQKTMRTLPNPSGSNGGNACSVNTGTQNMVLNSLPSGSTVLSAHLYWAGSSTTPDYTVNFDGTSITALAARQFTTSTTGSVYFAGAYDVTAQVQLRRNATYTVGGLTIDNSATYCNSQAVLGGFQLLVVYSLPSETFRVLNIYEGLQYVHNSAQSLVLSNFQIPDPIGTVTGRVGHITWEGDATLNDSEYLQYNGVAMQDSVNNGDNQFNSASNINGDLASYGIDFDAYTVRSPVIKGGDTQATTTYRSGQDLVVVNAEIIAAPNVPATDRNITMTLNNTLTPSLPSIYTITVGNNGPLTETGPIIVRDTLPASLIYTSATGTGWTCTMASQVVTCTYSGALAAGTTLPPIQLRVTPTANASGLVSNTARVSGSLFDYDGSNNSATVSVRVGQGGIAPVYLFTDTVCVHGQPFGSAAQPCKPLSLDGDKVIANEPIPMYITYVVNDVPTSLDTSSTTLKMKFALSCHNPGSANGRRATLTPRGASGWQLELCAQSGLVPPPASATWGSTYRDVVLPGNSPTSPVIYDFNYADVGRIELLMMDQAGKLGTTDPFVSRPRELRLPPITSVGVSPVMTNLAGTPTASVGDPRFIAAGDWFVVQVQAMSGGAVPVVTPNFGREDEPVTLLPAFKVATDADGNYFPDMRESSGSGDVTVRGALGAFTNGVASGQFAYDDVGIIKMSVQLADYLGTGKVIALPVNVGRFHPHHFDTVPLGPLPCGVKLVCPAGVGSAAYSQQPFDVQITARNSQGATTGNYRGAFARAVTLGAFGTAQGSAANPPTLPAGSSLSSTAVASTAFSDGVALGRTSYRFPAANAYTRAAPSARNWVPPTPVYFRGTESNADGTTSLGTGALEGGVLIVSGRMQIANAYGSDRLPLALKLEAQFYNGSSWLPSVADSVSSLALPADLAYVNCRRGTAAAACAYALQAGEAGTRTLANGRTSVKIAAPGIGNAGSGDVINNSPAWLPGGVARFNFGAYRAMYIYLREMH
ncbi:hypothetical protein ASC94_00390 [Massilia sp. Root418]|uniref:DUF11 domain-containing protein n=1 Tax=Massilia sp. Root418 TaxID=1736532 RepID=UPI0007020392|nr:DUF11 domain-containing protein [Massilia sp. Root418]KQX01150.1 hypothetical protein ASC94_00390 [Massilia sp. Root418]